MTSFAAFLTWMLVLVPWSRVSVRAVPVAVAVTREFPASARQQAMMIAWCEARFDNSRIGGAGEVSTWQIHPVHFYRFDRARLRADVYYATWAAGRLWEEHGGFGPWTTRGGC